MKNTILDFNHNYIFSLLFCMVIIIVSCQNKVEKEVVPNVLNKNVLPELKFTPTFVSFFLITV